MDPNENVLQAAARMKEAQLKEKPERREWEAAPHFFKWTCGNYEEVLAARKMTNFSDKLERAKCLRYSHAIAIFYWFQRRDGRYVDEVKLLNNLTEEPVTYCEFAWCHLSSCFLNAASVLMKQKKFKDAIFSCKKALEFKRSAKAHFRLAQANYALESTHHLEMAVKECQHAAAIDPLDAVIRSCLIRWRSELMKQNQKDRKSFKNIFKQGELYTKDDIQPNVSDAPLYLDDNGWFKPPFSEQARKQAAELGIDLEDKEVQRHLMQALEKKRHIESNSNREEAERANKYPKNYLEFWSQLVTGKLKWRWHYILYIGLVVNTVIQTFRLLMARHNLSSDLTRELQGPDDDF